MFVDTDYYYSAGFDGNGKDNPSVETALKRAEILVDTITDGKCKLYAQSEDLYPAVTQLKQAVSAQAEYYLQNGYSQQAVSGRVGDFSYSTDGFKLVCGLTHAILSMSNLYSSSCEAV